MAGREQRLYSREKCFRDSARDVESQAMQLTQEPRYDDARREKLRFHSTFDAHGVDRSAEYLVSSRR